MSEEGSSSSSSAPSAAAKAEEIQQKIQTASEFKAKGNEFFKKGELIPALREYHSSLTYLHGLNKDAMGFGGGGDEDHKKAMADVDAEISLIYSNMAAVHIKNKKWPRAIACSTDALKKNKDNKKAAYRKALALNASGEVNKAKNLLDDLDQTDASVKQLIRQIEQEEKARSNKADSTFRGMFTNKAAVSPPPAAAPAAARAV